MAYDYEHEFARGLLWVPGIRKSDAGTGERKHHQYCFHVRADLEHTAATSGLQRIQSGRDHVDEIACGRMGRPRRPGKLFPAWIREYADDPRGEGEQGVVRSLDGIHAGATCGRAAGDCACGAFSCFGCEQLFYRKQSGRGWRVTLLVKDEIAQGSAEIPADCV